MATVAETISAYAALGTRIYQAASSGLFDEQESALLSQLHTALTAAARNFQERPAYGTTSPKYEAPIAAANNASTALAAAKTGALDQAATAIRGAIQTLVEVTGKRAPGFGLRGALRLRRAPAGPILFGTRSGDAGDASGGDSNYYNKLITLFPAEALTLYGTGLAIFGAMAGPSAFWVILVCLIVLLAVRWKANQPTTTEGGTDRPAVAVAIISFVLWATATDPSWIGAAPKSLRVIPGVYDGDLIRKWAAFLGAAFVFIAPAFVEPKDTP
jgi:hypothetical protein